MEDDINKTIEKDLNEVLNILKEKGYTEFILAVGKPNELEDKIHAGMTTECDDIFLVNISEQIIFKINTIVKAQKLNFNFN